MGFGVTQETWYPDPTQTGADYKLSEGLAPLARHKSDFTLVQGCSNQFSNQAHYGSTFWLTGANRYAVPGQNMANSISADQVVARHLGKDTRFSSMPLASEDSQGHGPGLSLAWSEKGKPVGGWNDPLRVFHKLFSADDMPLAQRQAAIAENRSVLDAVLMDAKRVQRGLSKTDTDKLDEYFQGIRDVETRLNKDEDWLDVPKAKAPLDEPEPGLKGKDEIELMYKLIVAAIQTDSTRAITYRMPAATLLTSLDIGMNPHTLSHYAPGPRMDASKIRDKAHCELLAGLLDKLTQSHRRYRRLKPFGQHDRCLWFEHPQHSLSGQLPDDSGRRRRRPQNGTASGPAQRHPALQCVAHHAAWDGHRRRTSRRQFGHRQSAASMKTVIINQVYVSFITLCACVALQAEEQPQVLFAEKHFAFIDNYCLSCHDADTQKGKVNLEDLSFQIQDLPTAELWQEVLNTVNAGEMPPEKKKQPKPQEKADFLADLADTMVLARKALSDYTKIRSTRSRE